VIRSPSLVDVGVGKESLVRLALRAGLVLVGVLTTLSSLPASAAVRTKPAAVLRHEVTLDTDASRALNAEAQGHGVSVPILLAQWQRVAICEVDGNWSMTGPVYSGIGFSNATWHQFGGARFAPLAGEATREQQILIGMRVTHGWVPDQRGCSPTGW
jgi:hypothetical protein